MTNASVAATTKLSKADVLSQWAKFLAIVKEWEHSDAEDLVMTFKGRQTRAISEAVFQGFRDIADLIDSCEFERDAWPVVLAIDEVYYAFDEWGRLYESNPRETDPWGTERLWHAVGRVVHSCREFVPKPVESVQQLASLPHMPISQIAKTYGWYNEIGEPDVQKVKEEIESPGKHTKNWVNPIIRRREEALELAWAERTAKFSGRSFMEPRDNMEVATPKPELPDAPETVEELLRLKDITLEQVAKMKKMSIDDVRHIAREMRIPIDHTVMAEMSLSPASKIPGLQRMVDEQTQMDMSRFYTYPELATMEERIDAMLDDRIKPGVVATALKQSYPAISYQFVKKRQNERKLERVRHAAELRAASSGHVRPSDASAPKPKRKTKQKDNPEAAGQAADPA